MSGRNLFRYVLLPALGGLILLAMVALLPAKAPAAANRQVEFIVGQKRYFTDGQVVRNVDVAPFIQNGRTYVPVRYLGDALGASIVWESATRKVVLTKATVEVELVIGSNIITVNGKSHAVDVAPLIRDGRTFLPARYVAEAFDYVVQWDAETSTVILFPVSESPVPGPDKHNSTNSAVEEVLPAVGITDIQWDLERHTIHVRLCSWPGIWPGWRMFVDGTEVPMEGGPGEPVIRPDAPLDQPPTGLIVGTLPWITGLDNVDFPCCGTIQFYIPGQGLTNAYQFNLRDLACVTASPKECPSEWAVHEGDLIIGDSEVRLIENAKFFQKGNIYVRDHATLIIRSSELMMARGDVPTVHVYIFVDPMAKLIIDNSRIYPPPGGGTEGGLVCVINRGEVRMTASPTSIHYFDMSEGARLVMANSEMVSTIGGLLQVTGGDVWVTDSTLGALALSVPAGAHLEVAGLRSGVYFESWDVHEMIPDADYNLVLKRTTILKDDFTGELRHGPYERGWIFFLDPDAHVRISDSELRKVFLEVRSDAAEFEDLRAGIPSNLTYRDIVLSDVVVVGQWPFTITDSDVTITNSDYLFLQPSGLSTVKLIDSHMVEFIPRDFFGTMIFENGLWTTAGEIIGGIPHHSMANDFAIKGSLRMEGLQENLQWKDARVKREFDVIVTDVQGHPVSGVVIKVGGKAYVTDDAGKTKFKIIFNETNYNRPTTVEVWQAGRLIAQQEIDFFIETPIRIVMK